MTFISTLSRMAPVVLMLWLNAAGAAGATEPLTQELVAGRAAILYAERLDRLTIDADADFTARVRAIAQPLIAQAARDHPETLGWAWEIHTTSEPAQNADCMAGGKILVSAAYVERLGLGDAELAMLLAHEIAHAALRHNLREYQQALLLDPRWARRPHLELEHAVDHDSELMDLLAATNYQHEQEADREGLLLAWRAGWPAARLATYFKKTARASDRPRRGQPDYPSPMQRWQAARELANTLQKNYVQAPD